MLIIISWNNMSGKADATMTKTFYSFTSFMIWLRVVHLLKSFGPTSYVMRMAGEILYAMRHLIWFVVISVIAFGFTFYFLSESPEHGAAPI